MKQDLLNKIMIFTAGVIIGSVVTWKVIDMKQEVTTNISVEEPVEQYVAKDRGDEIENVKEEEEDEQNVIQYNKIINSAGYSADSKDEKEEANNVEAPYMIPPDEFSELDGYRTETLYWYEDGTIVDEMENEIDDAEDIVGKDALVYFKDFNDDSLYVRNDARKTDYEILRG